MPTDDIFYLEKLIPKPEDVFKSSFVSAADLFANAIVVLDTNALLVPYDVSKESRSVILRVLRDTKSAAKLRIPARVAREFGKNRAKRVAELCGKLREIQNKLNANSFVLENYPLLEGLNDFKAVMGDLKDVRKGIESAKGHLKKLETELRNWSGQDKVSNSYKSIFTRNIIVDCLLPEKDLHDDLSRRIKMKIPPGYKDSGKPDEGIGDLIIWQTMIEIATKEKRDVVFVTNEEKSDWVYRDNKEPLFPRFELLYEFNDKTKGQQFGLMNFVDFLRSSNVKKEDVTKMEEEITVNWDDTLFNKINTLRPFYTPNRSVFSTGSDGSGIYGTTDFDDGTSIFRPRRLYPWEVPHTTPLHGTMPLAGSANPANFFQADPNSDSTK